MNNVRWFIDKPQQKKGVIIACDSHLEWMLPFFCKKLFTFNSLPLTIIDAGLSTEGKAFCNKVGQVIDLNIPDGFHPHPSTIHPEVLSHWESITDIKEDLSWWHKRRMWHMKPFAMLMTPYASTLWLDIDCEVLTDLSDLWQLIENDPSIHITPWHEKSQKVYREKRVIHGAEKALNSGVVGYSWGCPYMLEWAAQTLIQHAYFLTDEDLLSRISFLNEWPLNYLDTLYNWMPHELGYESRAKIYHWMGQSGKTLLSLRMNNLI